MNLNNISLFLDLKLILGKLFKIYKICEGDNSE